MSSAAPNSQAFQGTQRVMLYAGNGIRINTYRHVSALLDAH
jgi:hypothetical protein